MRYTQKQRQRDLRSRQYADEHVRTLPAEVHMAESLLSDFNSRAAGSFRFKDYFHFFFEMQCSFLLNVVFQFVEARSDGNF
jgi:hypothetical protein